MQRIMLILNNNGCDQNEETDTVEGPMDSLDGDVVVQGLQHMLTAIALGPSDVSLMLITVNENYVCKFRFICDTEF